MHILLQDSRHPLCILDHCHSANGLQWSDAKTSCGAGSRTQPIPTFRACTLEGVTMISEGHSSLIPCSRRL